MKEKLALFDSDPRFNCIRFNFLNGVCNDAALTPVVEILSAAVASIFEEASAKYPAFVHLKQNDHVVRASTNT